MKYLGIVFSLFLIISACKEPKRVLPILGERDFVNGDTVYATIPPFSFVNQDNITITNTNYHGKVYVVDFFFTHCPTICPKVKKNMLRLYQRYYKETQFYLLSHTIDPKRDSVGRLNEYAKNMGIHSMKWSMVTGDKFKIYDIANRYFAVAKEDPDAPGGFDHSGNIILVDGQGRVRSFCDGTDAASVDKFMNDIDLLLAETKGIK
jgi:protein SCO1